MVLDGGKSRLPEGGVNPAGEQFLRSRVVPRRGASRSVRAVLRWMGAAAGLAGLITAGFWTASAAGRAPELAVSRIRVEGNHHLSEGEILEALGLQQGSNILNLDLEALKQQLLGSPWIQDVQLTRVLPATLTLTVVERQPIGVAVLDRLYLIDEEGSFLDEMGPRYAGLAPPLVHGLADAKGRLVANRPELAGRVLWVLARDERLEAAVSEIDVTEGAGSIKVHLRHPPLTLLVGEEDLAARLVEILPLAEGIFERFPALRAVDLRFEGRIYLQLRAELSAEGEASDGPGVAGGR